MPTSFDSADIDTCNLLIRVMKFWHHNLLQADVHIGILMAYNPEGEAVTHGGYPAAAKIKAISARDRVRKKVEAEIEIDQSIWNDLKQEQRIALLDHELSHLKLVPLSLKELQIAQAYDSAAHWWKIDDKGRPKVKTIKADWNVGDGFKDVVSRHGPNAIEYRNIAEARARADVAKKEGDEEREKTLLDFMEDRVSELEPATLRMEA